MTCLRSQVLKHSCYVAKVFLSFLNSIPSQIPLYKPKPREYNLYKSMLDTDGNANSSALALLVESMFTGIGKMVFNS